MSVLHLKVTERVTKTLDLDSSIFNMLETKCFCSSQISSACSKHDDRVRPVPLQLTMYPGPVAGRAKVAAATVSAGAGTAGTGAGFSLGVRAGSDDLMSGLSEHPAIKANAIMRQDRNFIFPASFDEAPKQSNRAADCYGVPCCGY